MTHSEQDSQKVAASAAEAQAADSARATTFGTNSNLNVSVNGNSNDFKQGLDNEIGMVSGSAVPRTSSMHIFW